MENEEKKVRKRPTIGQVKELESVIAGLEGEKRLLERSNEYMEKELALFRERCESLSNELSDADKEITYYRNRSFYERLKDLFRA